MYFVPAKHSKIRNTKIDYKVQKNFLNGKKATLSWNSMIQSRSRGLDLFTMMTCLGYMHSTGRIKVPTQTQGRVHWVFLTCTCTCMWSYVKVYRNYIHMTNMSAVVPSIILSDGIVFTSERSIEYVAYRIHAVNSQLRHTYHVMNFAP